MATRIRSLMVAVAVLAAGRAYAGWLEALVSVVMPPLAPVFVVSKAAQNPTPDNVVTAIVGTAVPFVAVADQVLPVANAAVKSNPELDKALDKKSISVSLPMEGGGPSGSSSAAAGSGPLAGSATQAVPDNVADITTSLGPPPTAAPQVVVTVVQGSEAQGSAAKLPDLTASVGPPAAATTGDVVAATQQNAADGPALTATRVFGPSQIADADSKEEAGDAPFVPTDHINRDEYFKMEAAAEEAAKELNIDAAPITSAYRDAASGPHPSPRHANAAVDVFTTNQELARAVSEKLGDDYFVQVELTDTPRVGWQTNIRFVQGTRLPDEPPRNCSVRKNCGTRSHMHIQLGR